MRCRATEVAVERQVVGRRRRVGAGERYAEQGVGTEPALVGRAVELDERLVDARLVRRIEPDDGRADRIANVADRGQHALAPVARSIAVAKLDGLVGARGSAGRHRRPTERSIGQGDVHLDRWIAARIEDLARVDELDCRIHDFLAARDVDGTLAGAAALGAGRLGALGAGLAATLDTAALGAGRLGGGVGAGLATGLAGRAGVSLAALGVGPGRC